MKRMYVLTRMAGLMLAVSFCTCQLTGGGTETTNGISGCVAGFSGTPADGSGPVAAVYSVNYRPDSAVGVAETTIVKADGSFTFSPPPGNRYNLFVWDTLKREGVFLPQLSSDTVVGIVQLKEAGTLRTTRPDPIVGASPYSGYLVVITGSPYYFKAAAGTSVTIPLLPQGAYRVDLGLVPKGASAAAPVWNSQPTFITVDPAVEDTVLIMAP